MRLGELLNQVRELHPHFFNSFYRRVRVVREVPQPLPASATVDVTHTCSLRCPFCIAADVLEQGEMPLQTFHRVAAELKGIGRLTLIGGEPAQHPDFSRLVELSATAAGEVEVFTNGLFLGASPDRAAERIRARIAEADSAWLTLVLSVDPHHAAQMPPNRLARAVDGLLAAESRGVCKARFSVTHQRLRTGTYLDTDVITNTIGEVSEALSRLFMERLMEGRILDTFYFNSVICSLPPTGETPGASDDAPETLRLEDLVFAPEIAISFDASGEACLFTSLASVWTRQPPPATSLGSLDRARSRIVALAEAADALQTAGPWQEAWEKAQELADPQAQAALRRARTPFAHIMGWDCGVTLCNDRAERVATFVEGGPGDRVLRWGGDESSSRLDTLQLRLIIRHLLVDSIRNDSLRAQLEEWLAALVGAGGDSRIPVYRGAREILGMRVPLARGQEEPLERVHLPQEPGFGPRDELVVRPVLQLHSDGTMALLFTDIASQPGRLSTGELRIARARLLDMLAHLCGAEFAGRVATTALGTEGRSLVPEDPGELLLPGPDDLVAAFEECTFDRNRQRPDEDNGELLALIMLHAPKRYSPRSVASFRSRALTWLERLGPRGLSPTTRHLLSRLSLRGKNAARLKRLMHT